MKHVKSIFALALSLPTLFSCGNKPSQDLYTITFNPNGGTITSGTSSIQVKSGSMFSECQPPTVRLEGQEFKYWTFDQAGNKPVDANFVINSDYDLFAKYYVPGSIHFESPDDSSLVCYGSSGIAYSGNKGKVTVTNSNPNILTAELDEQRSCIYFDAVNGNVEGESTITISDSVSSDSITIDVHHPKTIQEAGESFDFALGRGVYDITLTFNYNNQDDLDTFFNDRMETRLSAPFIYNDYVWSKGTNKTNSVSLAPSDKMATKSSDIEAEHSQYYYKNLKNAAYELRHSKIQRRTENHFAIDDAKKRLKIHNSETLFFALERGFRPEFDSSEIAINGSVAQRAYQVYQKAREACADAFGIETTDDLMKVRQLFEWLMDNTHYDHWIVSDAFTDTNFWEWTSYFAEGVFLNKGIAVCDGFSKALAIMGGIEGLPIIRSAGFATYEDEEGEPVTSGHAWNYYHHSDGKWYLICPTWAHNDNKADSESINYNHSAISYQPFMTQSNYFYDHSYKIAYNYCIKKGATESEAKVFADEAAKESDFKEVLFTDIVKSSAPLVANIYTTDVFDKSKGYNFDLNSDAEATALGNALPTTLKSDFCIDLSYDSWDYLQSLANVIYNRLGAKGINASADYSYSNCTIYVKF